MTQDAYKAAVQAAIDVPDYIRACANSCYYDLMHGPSWSRIPQGDITKFNDDCLATYREDLDDEAESGDLVTETYTGPVGDALRAFLGDLPSRAWVDADCDCYMTREPEAEFISDDDGDSENDGERGFWQEPHWESIYQLDRSDIVAALFGPTIAREFH